MSHQHSTNKRITMAVMLVLMAELVTVSQVHALRLAYMQTGLDPEPTTEVSLNKDLHDIHDALSQQRDHAMNLRDFVTKHDGKTCLSVSGGMGGLANTMGFVNVMLETALEVGATPKWPTMNIPAHGIGNAFADLFGSESCNQAVETYSVHCSSKIATGWQKGRCMPGQYAVGSVSQPKMVKYCGCDRLVLVNAHDMTWHFNYNTTGPYLRDGFWATHPSQFMLPGTNLKSPGSNLISVAIHVRLGDSDPQVKDKQNKHTDPVFHINALKALEKIFDKEAMHVTIVTDSPDHNEVHKIKEAARDNVSIQSSSVEDAFFTMVYSDILIAGNSGFSRLAAVLQVHTQPSFRVVTKTNRHPLSYLMDTVNVENPMEDAIFISPENPSIVALKKRSEKFDGTQMNQ